MTDEKRKYLRFECLVPVDEIHVQGLNGSPGKVAVDNISREGVRIVMDVDVAFNPGLDLDFTLSRPEKKNPIAIRAKVIWSRPKGNRFEVGMRILNMDKAAKAELLEMGFDQWRKEKTPSRSGSKG
jgi:hypothetical protein